MELLQWIQGYESKMTIGDVTKRHWRYVTVITMQNCKRGWLKNQSPEGWFFGDSQVRLHGAQSFYTSQDSAY